MPAWSKLREESELLGVLEGLERAEGARVVAVGGALEGVLGEASGVVALASLGWELASWNPWRDATELGRRLGFEESCTVQGLLVAREAQSRGALVGAALLARPDWIAALWRAEEASRGMPGAAEERVGALSEACGLGGGPEELARALLGGALVRATSPMLRRRGLRALTRGVVGAGDPTGALGAALARCQGEVVRRQRGQLTWLGGLPGSGKSSWGRREAARTGAVLLGAEGPRRRDRQAARTRMWEEAGRQLSQGADVILDATHLSRSARDVLLGIAERQHARVRAVWFEAPLPLALARQDTRPWRDAVSGEVLTQMCARRELPAPDEYDELLLVSPEGVERSYEAPVWRGADEA